MSGAESGGARVPMGKVLLVGAGPGDPDLITVRGAAALADADVVVYDALASGALLALTTPGTECINVGKCGHDAPTRSQTDINALLVEHAAAGKTVVRLKGGDPFVFGRGGEEASACVEAGVPFEVVPGVSSAVGALAYAGIPLTDRRYSASFAVVTGHKDPTRVSEETRWRELAAAADTLVILMGMRNLEGLLAKLMDGGRPPDTPAAAVWNGTLPSQRVVEGTLGSLADAVRRAGVGSPAAIVIGDVVRLRSSLQWFEKRPLFGCRVLVTRAAEQADEWSVAFRRAGADPIVVPMIEAQPTELGPIDAALSKLADYDGVLFTSANAIRFLDARARELDIALAEVSPAAACVGPATAERARALGLSVAVVPESQFDAEGLLASVLRWSASRSGSARRPRWLLPQAQAARAVLAEGLRAAGGEVDVVPVYKTVPAAVDGAELRERLVSGGFDALTFASPSTVRQFASLLDRESRKAAGACAIAAIGPVTAEALRGEGLAPDVVPERAALVDLVSALGVHVERRRAQGGSR